MGGRGAHGDAPVAAVDAGGGGGSRPPGGGTPPATVDAGGGGAPPGGGDDPAAEATHRRDTAAATAAPESANGCMGGAVVQMGRPKRDVRPVRRPAQPPVAANAATRCIAGGGREDEAGGEAAVHTRQAVDIQ